MKILWLTNIPSPYRLKFFEQLAKHCELTVLFERASSSERDDKWKEFSFDGYEGIVLSGIKIGRDKAFSFRALRYLLSKKYDKIILTDFLSPMGMMAVATLKLFRRKYILESDGGFAKEESFFKRAIKRFCIKGASMYFSTGKTHDDYYLNYGAKPEKIVRYPFSSVLEQDVLPSPLTKEEKRSLKDKLHVTEEKAVLFVGQMIHRKGIDILLESAKSFDDKVGFYLVGGTPTEEYASYVAEHQLTNVHFIPFVSGEEMKEYYKMADLFVLPSREDIWGLVINEAMAYALPVITTKTCAAGIELISDMQNGCLVENNTAQELAHAVKKLLYDDALCEEIGKRNLEKIRNHTIESMVQSHQLQLGIEDLQNDFEVQEK